MVSAKVETTSAIFAVRIYHAADVGQPSIDFLLAIGVIAQRRDAVPDVAIILSYSN
jgi:hypothetical protein